MRVPPLLEVVLLVVIAALVPITSARTGRVLARREDGSPLVTLVLHQLDETHHRTNACPARRRGDGDVKVAVLLPEDVSYECSVRKVAPALLLALQSLQGRRLLLGKTYTLHLRDTRCSSIYAPAHAVQAYIDDGVTLLLGPACDFSLAPVARLVKFWNVPLITAGGLSYDFALPKTQPDHEYYMTTRTGLSFTGIAATIGKIIDTFNWRKVMLMYEKDAYDAVSGHQTCYLAMASLVTHLKTNNVSYGTFDLEKNQHFTLRENLQSEIGFDYGDVFLGPVCEYVIAAVARYAAVWKVPVITPGAQANAFLAKQRYSTLTRIMGSYHQLGTVFQPIMQLFGWKVAGLLYEDYGKQQNKGHHPCNFMLQAVYQGMSVKPFYKSFSNSDSHVDFASLLRELMKAARIIILCASPQRVREILLVAEELNMVSSGEYVFFNVELFTSKTKLYRPWFEPSDTDAANERARRAYEALLTVTARAPDDSRYKLFSDQVKAVALEKFNYTYPEPVVNTFVASFHEAVTLYAYALNDTLRQGYSISNGSAVTRAMWNRTFQGITGMVSIDGNGDRKADYSLLDMDQETGHFEVVANYYGVTHEFAMERDKKIHWSGGRTSPPPDTPRCGFDGSLCPDTAVPKYAIVSIALSAVMLVMLASSLFMYRHYKLEAELASMTWKISWDDVLSTQLPHSTRGKFGSRISMARGSLPSNYSADSVAVNAMTKQVFVKTGYYKGTVVAIKMLATKKLDINRDLLLELKRMKDLHHDHLVRFIGLSVEPPNLAVFTEYCPKGSLQDILENEQIKLDWMFRYSLMHDIVKGMAYLHSSEIRSHGKLKSSNCVVDSRFVLKITDFGIRRLTTDDENPSLDSYAYWKRRLWTAPELLRTHVMPVAGTQKGDVYSFAIIVQEIIMRLGTFYVHNDELSPRELVENVRNGQRPPFRPAVDEDVADDEVLHMMRRCWAEDPFDRPDFQALKGIIRRLNKDNESGNILDNLLSRMEQYANNLEALVEERTADYLEEKRKCEELLYQLLPKSVASQLIAGKSVVAEHYDSVTIYFSDIVGFTAISAESTPMQVVDLLNDLYTCFDSIIESFDVYKVETIGDAYMVVSGLPMRNGAKHAGEIASMSLALLEAVQNFRIRHRPDQQIKLRIGLHTGPVVAGVVGLKMPRYCLFGDTVNTSSRMESNGLPLRIHVSSQTKEVLDKLGHFSLELRGEVEMKGKGKQITYWLREKRTDLIDIEGGDLRETKV